MESMVNKDIDIFDNFYNGKRVLVTGHTGFKGSWLSIWLHELGAEVIGVAKDPYTEKDNYVLSGLNDKIIDLRGDITDGKQLKDIFAKYQPDIVFHLAAQPLVRLSYEIPVETYQTNVMGTINILEAIRSTESVKVGVMITTDKCYENKEQIWGYRENEPMGGYDPYSSSKGAAEIAIASWRRSFMTPGNYEKHGKSIASVRAGNVIGGGDWAKDRIIPDCIRALEADKPINIRNPKAIRPWQHVLEPLSGYMLLAKKMWEEPWNCKGSIISAEGMLYIYDERRGNVGLLKANPEKFDLVSSFQITQGITGPFWTHPVIHKGILYLRHTNALMAYDIKAK